MSELFEHEAKRMFEFVRSLGLSEAEELAAVLVSEAVSAAANSLKASLAITVATSDVFRATQIRNAGIAIALHAMQVFTERYARQKAER